MRSLIVAGLLLAFAATATADYYSEAGKGWWWYEKVPPKVAEEKEKSRDVGPRPTRLGDYTYDQIWDMHPDNFEKLAEGLKKEAVRNPSEENVRDYYEVQEIARKKALAFTNVSQYVWQKYPELSTKKDYPITTPGNLGRMTLIREEKSRKLRENRDDFALIYFFRPDCSYCADQAPILEWFTNSTGWVVKRIDTQENPALAARFRVEITPTLVLIQKGNQDYFPVSSGVISSDEIEDRTYRAVRLLKGEITPEEFSLYDFQRGGGFDVKKRPFAPTEK
jgi:conjugal transfer pilus assembly protein TraF